MGMSELNGTLRCLNNIICIVRTSLRFIWWVDISFSSTWLVLSRRRPGSQVRREPSRGPEVVAGHYQVSKLMTMACRKPKMEDRRWLTTILNDHGEGPIETRMDVEDVKSKDTSKMSIYFSNSQSFSGQFVLSGLVVNEDKSRQQAKQNRQT